MAKSSDPDGRRGWPIRWSLTPRILAVNIFALGLLAGGFFYLDSYRTRLIDDRLTQLTIQSRMISATLDATPVAKREALAGRLGQITGNRVRIYGAQGQPLLDSWRATAPTYELRDPSMDGWRRRYARFLDRVIDQIVGADQPEIYAEPETDAIAAWPEVRRAQDAGGTFRISRRALDRTPMLSVATPLPDRAQGTMLLTASARDLVSVVRAERFRLGIVLALVVLVSVGLSLFLARTIARPLRRLALAAHRVRLGRALEVQVPRLPARRDEIGTLARALSDMSLALRQRIDATEAFAADVAHELKNPLASLRSAVDSLDLVRDPELQTRLIAVVRDDVARLDRLITDISEASRVDAELARTRFETLDLGQMIEGLIAARDARREARGDTNGVRLAFARPQRGIAVAFGDGSRLTRLFENLIDNAISFSPPGGLVRVSATRDDNEVIVYVDDEGPGVPAEARQEIFNRFHSVRPESEAFGRHSGLGLAIAKAIVEGHSGSIAVVDREDGGAGARFVIRLPVAQR